MDLRKTETMSGEDYLFDFSFRFILQMLLLLLHCFLSMPRLNLVHIHFGKNTNVFPHNRIFLCMCSTNRIYFIQFIMHEHKRFIFLYIYLLVFMKVLSFIIYQVLNQINIRIIPAIYTVAIVVNIVNNNKAHCSRIWYKINASFTCSLLSSSLSQIPHYLFFIFIFGIILHYYEILQTSTNLW